MSDILNKYTNTIKELENICNEIKILQKITNDKINRERSTTKKNEIFAEFMKCVDKMRRDKELTKRYKKLREREAKLFAKLFHNLNKYEKIKKNKNSSKKSKNLTSCNESETTEIISRNGGLCKINNELFSMVDKYKNQKHTKELSKHNSNKKHKYLSSDDTASNSPIKKHHSKKSKSKKHKKILSETTGDNTLTDTTAKMDETITNENTQSSYNEGIKNKLESYINQYHDLSKKKSKNNSEKYRDKDKMEKLYNLIKSLRSQH